MGPDYQFPFLGDGMVIGTNAIIHVLISHGVAIGLFIAFVILEQRLDRSARNNAEREVERAWLGRLLRWIVLSVTIGGAVTGAGIWFTTMALAPRGIATMLRLFFWVWFTEWFVFIAEVVVLLVYYLRWRAWDRRPRLRRRAGILYGALAVLSAVLITGNLGFMLTPGDWTREGGFWNAFLNPSYLPQLAARLAIAALLGGTFLIAWCGFVSGPARARRDGLRLGGWLLLGGTTALIPALLAYVSKVPLGFVESTRFAVLTSAWSDEPWLFTVANATAMAVLLTAGWAAARGSRSGSRWLVLPALLFAAAVVVEFERVREFIRGPYLLPEYMYANGVLCAERPLFEDRGFLPQGADLGGPLAEGERVFDRNCSVCHTRDGINGIVARVRERSPDGLVVLMDYTHEMVPFMVPMAASAAEKRRAAWFLHLLAEEASQGGEPVPGEQAER